MANVFISYASSERAYTEALAEAIEKAGYTVWWDKNLLAGRRFGKEITTQLDACHSAVVIWTPTSITRDWVLSEAEHARQSDKLVSAFGGGRNPRKIPKPFDLFHAVPVENHDEVIRALRQPPNKPSDVIFLNGSLALFRKHARRLRKVANKNFDDAQAYTHELVTAATMLAEPLERHGVRD